MYTYLEMQLHPISSASYCLSLILVGSEKGGGHGGKQAVKGCFSGVLRKLKGWQLGESKAGDAKGCCCPPLKWEANGFPAILKVFQILCTVGATTTSSVLWLCLITCLARERIQFLVFIVPKGYLTDLTLISEWIRASAARMQAQLQFL